MTKWQTRQALYLLGLTGILYLFSCKSQVIASGFLKDHVEFSTGHAPRFLNFLLVICPIAFSHCQGYNKSIKLSAERTLCQ